MQVVVVHAGVGGSAQLLRELVGVDPQVEPDGRERDALSQVVGRGDHLGDVEHG